MSHQCVLRWDTLFGATVGQMFKCQLCQRGGLMCTICYSCTTYRNIEIRRPLSVLGEYFLTFKLLVIYHITYVSVNCSFNYVEKDLHSTGRQYGTVI
jgi:hypothetical protein